MRWPSELTDMDLSKLQTSVTPHPASPTEPQVRIDLTVHNLFDHAVTIQIWDTPLDPRCALLGVIDIFDCSTNTLVPLDKISFARQMPPSRDSYVEIGSQEDVTNTVSIPNVKLDAAKNYRIEVKGSWKVVWSDGIEGINAKSLKDMTGGYAGAIASSSAIIKADGDGKPS